MHATLHSLVVFSCSFVATLHAASNSNFISSARELQRRLKTELHVTQPDYIVFVPTVTNTNVTDTGRA